MTDGLDPASMIEAAEKAAAAGDFPAAEPLLREAAVIQEATLGSLHPDLATTLNNLALVCERTNNIAEAERAYRRAHKIAVASLGPRHPFVATSVKNLVDFCAAHEIPIWVPPGAAASAQPEVTTPTVTRAETSTAPAVAPAGVNTMAERREERAPVTGTGWPVRRTFALATLGVAVIAAVVFSMRWRETASPSDQPPSASTTPALTQGAPSVVPVAPVAVPVEPKRDAAPARVERPVPREKVERPASRDRSVAAQPVTVLNAQLCSAIKKQGSPDWQCASANRELPPGTYTFYTRLLTNANTTVEHRWYRDDRVHQVMRLRVTASPSTGFRTFSSTTISPERAGDWRVEVRAADGTSLQEEHFAIR